MYTSDEILVAQGREFRQERLLPETVLSPAVPFVFTIGPGEVLAGR
jgi:hypothetical protein